MSSKVSTFGWVTVGVLCLGVLLMIVASKTPAGEVVTAMGIVMAAIYYRQHHPSPIDQIANRRKKANPNANLQYKPATDGLGRKGESKGT
jgi:hypothetical protein